MLDWIQIYLGPTNGFNEQELATKMLQIQSKRFYLDVKQNRRGKFIKVAEIGADGRRSQIFLALSTAAEFRDQLSTFSEYYAGLGEYWIDFASFAAYEYYWLAMILMWIFLVPLMCLL